MRMHIELDDALVERLDQVTGKRGRSAFVRSAIEAALRAELRWHSLESAAASLNDSTHDWDDDPAAWVRDQRQRDAGRVG